MQQQNRQLAAILFTDIVGYTAMMQTDEQVAVTVNKRYVSVLKQMVPAYGGEVLNDYGDGSLCSFTSATQAIKCAMDMQRQLQTNPKVPLRIGLHIGEIFFEDGKVFGDGVNIASRIQSLGTANSILYSSEINSKLKNQQEFRSISLGRFHFKNVEEPIEVFALANEGFFVPDKRQISGKLHEKKSSRIKSMTIIIPLICLLALLGYFGFRRLFNTTGANNREKSIAILPFSVIGANVDNLSEGLVEDILVHLSKIKELDKVISNRSSSKYADTKKSPEDIGEELQVNSLVMGSTQEIGDSIKVSAQLIDSKSGKTIWADNYTMGKQQIFEMETKLASKIADELQAKLTPTEQKGLASHYTDNVDAYKLYRKGRWFWDKRTKNDYDSAESYYKKALELDPDYALAYCGLADCYTFNQKGLSQTASVPIARDFANKAIQLDSNLTEAWTTLAFIQSHFDYDWEGSKKVFEKVIQENPNYAIAHLYYGNVLLITGNKEEAIRETKKALSLDPLSASINMVLGRNYYAVHDYESSIIQLQKAVIMNPGYLSVYMHLGLTYCEQKQYKQAIDAFSKMPPVVFDQGTSRKVFLAFAYSSFGDQQKARAEFAKIPADELSQVSPFYIAIYYSSLGDTADAITELELGYDRRAIQMMFLKQEPALDPVRNEPRFKALLKKMNLD